ncbi:MAG: ATPase, T2SS/T4P/T4SS family [Lentisphaeria bacterium]|jgi:type IV pilus assembly protein PilB|nr:ATPase, T2SS/T4P/T4SS family [Lentisphaeria bacterium]
MPNLDLDADVSTIWQMLEDAGHATAEQLEEVYEEHQRTGRDFTTVLYNYEIIKEDELLRLIAENLGTELVDIRQGEIPETVIQSITADTARTYQIIPFNEEFDVLWVAAADPMNYRMVSELNYVVGKECRIFVARPAQVADALDFFYPEGSGNMADILSELQEARGDLDTLDLDNAENLAELAQQRPIIRFVQIILTQAIKDQASDIHFEPFADEFRIRYRIDGALYEMTPPPVSLAVPVISRIKVMSGLNIAERRLPQDGRIELRISKRPVDLRVSSLPTQYGESVVLRVLDRSVVNLDLDSLGMPKDMVHHVRQTIHRPNGIFLVTGPTGCGKTTTLYSGLREINSIDDKLLTAEDPVEYDLEGIMQVQVREAVNMTFANALRAFLRQDPDRIMVGEIRDVETAGMAIQASLTGHLVLSTLHTNDAAGAVTRLIDMGIEPFLISSTLVAVLAQRLIRRICPNCKEQYEPSDAELDAVRLTREQAAGSTFCHGLGCEICNNSGYKGRIGIFELLRATPAIQRMINDRKPTMTIRQQAMDEGMETLRQSGIRLIRQGVTTVEEVLTYTMD